MSDIPDAAVKAAIEARYAHGSDPMPYNRGRCRCGANFATAVEQLEHATRRELEAAFKHLRSDDENCPRHGGDKDEPVCDCYPGGFSPETYEGPQHHCPVHGHGTDLSVSECPQCQADRQPAEQPWETVLDADERSGR